MTGFGLSAVTPRQLELLAVLVRVTADGWPATVRQVVAAAGSASNESTQRMLVALECAGLASRHPRSPRGGWRPTPLGRSAPVRAAFVRRPV